jgi:hypothetical protein
LPEKLAQRRALIATAKQRRERMLAGIELAEMGNPQQGRKKRDLSHERESSEQFVWLNRRYDETETQLSRSAMMPSIRADSSQSEGI